MAYVISAFPACGKSYIHNNRDRFGFKTVDSDSSKFSWILDEEGESTGIRNPEFPSNYIKHIRGLLGTGLDFIFVSTHKEVREALEENGINYVLVYPTLESKDTFMGYYRQRKSPQSFIDLMEKNWESFIKSCSITEKSQKVLPSAITNNQDFVDLLYCLWDSPYSGNMCYLWEM
ncbi:MAG: hypothetical protein ACRC7S_16455 [Cetobacterium sp.]